MFKLPTCPYCDTVYRYKDVSDIKEKEHKCYHCDKPFEVKKMPYILILIFITAVLCVALNLLILFNMVNFNIWLLLIPTACIIFVAKFLIPFFVKFKKTETKNSNIQK